MRTHAHATGIVLEGKRAVGIRYRKGGRDGTPMEVRAAKEVILSGGTVNSPQLLQVSGIGPAPLLQSLGIEVRHALPGVGENLRDHYAPRFVARVKNAETINEKSHGLKLVGEVLKYAIARKGILSLNPTLVYVFWKSDERVDNYDLQLTFTPASYKEGVQSTLDDFPGMTIASWQQRPDSTGYIRARSADPFEHPVIQPNYLVAESDRQVLLAGMKLARRLLALAGARQVLRPRGIPRRRTCSRTTSFWAPPSSAAPRPSISWAPAAWRRTAIPPPWSTISCACAGCRACAWSTPRSCRPCRRPTSMPRC